MTRSDSGPRREPGESLQGLAASGPSKVGVVRAMRARDVSRIRDEDRGAADGGPDGQTEGGSGSGGSSPVDS
ncbi:MAG: hypothetical protein ACXV2G_06705 [Actinomycetes bacterium]